MSTATYNHDHITLGDVRDVYSSDLIVPAPFCAGDGEPFYADECEIVSKTEVGQTLADNAVADAFAECVVTKEDAVHAPWDESPKTLWSAPSSTDAQALSQLKSADNDRGNASSCVNRVEQPAPPERQCAQTEQHGMAAKLQSASTMPHGGPTGQQCAPTKQQCGPTEQHQRVRCRRLLHGRPVDFLAAEAVGPRLQFAAGQAVPVSTEHSRPLLDRQHHNLSPVFVTKCAKKTEDDLESTEAPDPSKSLESVPVAERHPSCHLSDGCEFDANRSDGFPRSKGVAHRAVSGKDALRPGAKTSGLNQQHHRACTYKQHFDTYQVHLARAEGPVSAAGSRDTDSTCTGMNLDEDKGQWRNAYCCTVLSGESSFDRCGSAPRSSNGTSVRRRWNKSTWSADQAKRGDQILMGSPDTHVDPWNAWQTSVSRAGQPGSTTLKTVPQLWTPTCTDRQESCHMDHASCCQEHHRNCDPDADNLGLHGVWGDSLGTSSSSRDGYHNISSRCFSHHMHVISCIEVPPQILGMEPYEPLRVDGPPEVWLAWSEQVAAWRNELARSGCG